MMPVARDPAASAKQSGQAGSHLSRPLGSVDEAATCDQPVQAPLVPEICQTKSSVPCTNTSTNPPPRDTAAGLPRRTPPGPISVQALQAPAAPLHWEMHSRPQRPPSPPVTNRSSTAG